MAYWLVQAKPTTWDLFGAASDGEPIEAWTVSRYLGSPVAGDGLALWVSGDESGVYAVGEVTGPVVEITEDLTADPRWLDKEAAAKARYHLPIRLTLGLWSDPIGRDQLRADRRFANALIIKMPGGGNPFPLTDDEWAAIADRLPHVPASSSRGRNPPWATDELILALDLYLRHGLLDDGHPEVVALSNLLNSLPLHTTRPDLERFRNANGVALKLANFAALDPSYPGAGMRRGGRLDAEVWGRYREDPEKLRQLADAIRSGAQRADMPARWEDDEELVEEGRLLFRRHRAYERSRRLVDRKKAEAMRVSGHLACEACGFDFGETYGAIGHGFIECHHLAPLHETGPRRTTITDLALLCSNCHRIAHRIRPWPTVVDLRDLLRRD